VVGRIVVLVYQSTESVEVQITHVVVDLLQAFLQDHVDDILDGIVMEQGDEVQLHV